MNSIIEFLNQPIVVTLITVSIGSILLNVIVGRRSRKNELRDRAIDFLTQTSNDINSVISTIYGLLEGYGSESEVKLVREFTDLYAKRMSVQIGSQTYLNSEEFYQQYASLLKELEEVASFLARDQEQVSSEQLVSQIQKRRNRLGKDWPIENEMQQAGANDPSDELMVWMDMILHRTTRLFTNNLKSVID